MSLSKVPEMPIAAGVVLVAQVCVVVVCLSDLECHVHLDHREYYMLFQLRKNIQPWDEFQSLLVLANIALLSYTAFLGVLKIPGEPYFLSRNPRIPSHES
jgi:hypothetical protein